MPRAQMHTDGPLANFPAPVQGTWAYLATAENGGQVVSAGGYDVVYASDTACTSLLKWEVEKWDAATGAVLHWVQFPLVSNASDQTVYRCWGKSGVTTYQGGNPWDSNFVYVGHMSDASGSLAATDSSLSPATATITGATAYATGVVDGAAQGFTGSNQIVLSSNAKFSLSDMTLEGWVYYPSSIPGSYKALIEHSRQSGDWYGMFVNDSKVVFRWNDSGTGWIDPGNYLLNIGSWNYVVGTLDAASTTAKLYVNTILDTTTTGATVATPTASAVNFGLNMSGGENLQGYLDEIRISNIARSKDWQLATWQSLTSSTFVLVGAADSTAPAVYPAVPVLLDNQMIEDVDQMGDAAVLHVLAQQGEARIIAHTVSTDNVYGAPCAESVSNYYRHPGTVVGAYQGTMFGGQTSSYAQQVAAMYAPGQTRADFGDAVTVMRQALHDATDGSVVVVSTGYAQNLHSLLTSAADAIDSRTGSALVSAKVKSYVAMVGRFPSTGTPEHNASMSVSDWQYVIANWPTPMVFADYNIGTSPITAPPSGADPAVNPIKKAFDLFGAEYGSWGQQAILFAVRGLTPLFTYGGLNGTVSMDGSGNTAWSATAGTHSYIRQLVFDTAIGTQIDKMLAASPSGTRRRFAVQ
ncbi:MAG: hypothetical protein LAO06_17095 [Acidobacteriia bacterium]|nr:hypothetical protein [Terriglobia bacterium]